LREQILFNYIQLSCNVMFSVLWKPEQKHQRKGAGIHQIGQDRDSQEQSGLNPDWLLSLQSSSSQPPSFESPWNTPLSKVLTQVGVEYSKAAVYFRETSYFRNSPSHFGSTLKEGILKTNR